MCQLVTCCPFLMGSASEAASGRVGPRGGNRSGGMLTLRACFAQSCPCKGLPKKNRQTVFVKDQGSCGLFVLPKRVQKGRGWLCNEEPTLNTAHVDILPSVVAFFLSRRLLSGNASFHSLHPAFKSLTPTCRPA